MDSERIREIAEKCNRDVRILQADRKKGRDTIPSDVPRIEAAIREALAEERREMREIVQRAYDHPGWSKPDVILAALDAREQEPAPKPEPHRRFAPGMNETECAVGDYGSLEDWLQDFGTELIQGAVRRRRKTRGGLL